MPMMFVDELGFTTSEWLQVWAAFFFTTIFSGTFSGDYGGEMGWMKVIRWFGCIGMALSSLAFYYLPQHFGHNLPWRWYRLLPWGFCRRAFVPMAAVFRRWSRTIKARPFRSITCPAGLSNFLAPAIAVVLLPYFQHYRRGNSLYRLIYSGLLPVPVNPR